jgi:hypothetical protein
MQHAIFFVAGVIPVLLFFFNVAIDILTELYYKRLLFRCHSRISLDATVAFPKHSLAWRAGLFPPGVCVLRRKWRCYGGNGVVTHSPTAVTIAVVFLF